MNRIFLDTNIILDVLLERHPFCQSAQVIWSKVERKEVQAAISTLSVNNSFFIIRKLAGREKAYLAVETLMALFKPIAVDASTLSKALKLRFPDFEDAVQYYCALQFKAKAIISRDAADFKNSKLPIMDAAQYLSWMETK